MMYINKNMQTGNFSQLISALSDFGVTGDNLNLAEQYLDLDNPRDDSLLDKIQTQDFSIYTSTYGEVNRNLEKAIHREITRVRSDELEERYYLLISALGGVTCNVLGLHDVSSEDYNKKKAKILKAFRTRYGDNAGGFYLAVKSISYYTINHYGMRPEPANPEDCLVTVNYLSDYALKLHFVISAMNRIAPLEHTNPLQSIVAGVKQLVTNTNSLAQSAMKIMNEVIIPQNKAVPERNSYLLALALASGYDEKCFQLFRQEVASQPTIFMEWILSSDIDKDRILDVFEKAVTPTCQYIETIANASTERSWYRGLPNRNQRLRKLAKDYPEAYKQQMFAEKSIDVASRMEKILKQVDSSYHDETTLRDKARWHCIEGVTAKNATQKYQIGKYLLGEISTAEFIQTVLPNLELGAGYFNNGRYVRAYGLDDFAERCICYRVMLDYDIYYSLSYIPGYELENHEREVIEILKKHNVPMMYILNGLMRMVENVGHAEKVKEEVLKKLKDSADEIAKLDTKNLNVEARCARIEIFVSAGKYNYMNELFEATADSSKKVRELLVKYLPLPAEEVNSKILDLLQAKKIAQREIAVGLLEKKFPESYREAVQKAFEIEKNAKLQTRLGMLLNHDTPEGEKIKTSVNIIEEYSKGNTAKKVAWLFQNPFTPVHDKAGNEVEEKYLIALTNCYASMNIANFSRSPIADELAENLNQTELEQFAQEVFARFLDRGAEAKQKWVIYFTGILGGMNAITTLQHYIKEWSDHSRGAIASEAVKALAFNGSSSALMLVDSMARKYKNKQVRNAANAALAQAAEALHITREELADKIVPDLGFDENLCRIFDYGQRQFKVYLTPALELEIFEGEKKLKNLPKAGKNDDAEKAEQASKAFKEMKKQMKTTIQSQKARLEYVLLCDRKWSVEGWKELFIKKPVMHCFAMGLIWGAYDEKNQLLQTFRYLEDGSFTTSDEDEYELPENVQIGLVHPIELDEETISAWNEQLSDYEIKQPFLQLNRPIYKFLPEEKGKIALQRYSGTETTNLSLISKMVKFDWEKGVAEDAGMFYYFSRKDIASYVKVDNKIIYTGYYAELKFSGAYIASGYLDAEDVTIEDVKFWELSQVNKSDANAIKLDKVNPRYFSEIVAQLTTIFGGIEKENEE